MKRTLKFLALLMVMSFAASNAFAQIVVKVRPVRSVVVVKRSPAPSPRHVWVDEDWIAKRGNYTWHGGYWVAPPRQGAVYIPGHWKETRRGVIWVRGHWR